jgi:hypothetical protein
VTHGNGPQVGFVLLRSELARDVIHQVPLANCVADTQGSIGMQLAQSLQNEFLRQGMEQAVVALVTQSVVDEQDPSFGEPSKPIGPFMTEEEARLHERDDGWVVGEDAGRGCPQFAHCLTAARWSLRPAAVVFPSFTNPTAPYDPAPQLSIRMPHPACSPASWVHRFSLSLPTSTRLL